MRMSIEPLERESLRTREPENPRTREPGLDIPYPFATIVESDQSVLADLQDGSVAPRCHRSRRPCTFDRQRRMRLDWFGMEQDCPNCQNPPRRVHDGGAVDPGEPCQDRRVDRRYSPTP